MKQTAKAAAIAAVMAMITTLCMVAFAPPAEAQVHTCNGLEATMVGTPGPDELMGTDGPDVIVSLGGDDIIEAKGGDDVVCAGAGNDTVLGGPGNDEIRGQSGDDTLLGDSGECFDFDLRDYDFLCDTTLPGGSDRVLGGHGDDFLAGGLEGNHLVGGPGNDEIHSGPWRNGKADTAAATNRMWGSDGHDELHGFGNLRMFGGEGDDYLNAAGGLGTRARLFGEVGDDEMVYYGPSNRSWPGPGLADAFVDVFGGDGDDTASIVTEGSATFYGGFGNDSMRGHEDVIGALRSFGGPGDDVLGSGIVYHTPPIVDGGPGNDIVAPVGGIARGGEGDDQVTGGGTVSGGPGNDQIVGMWGTARGGSGNDMMFTETAGARLQGDSGDDILFAGWGADVTLAGNTGNDACGSNSAFDPTVTGCETEQTEPPFDPIFLIWDIYLNWYC